MQHGAARPARRTQRARFTAELEDHAVAVGRRNDIPRSVVQGTLGRMKGIRVHVENGRISGDAPPGLPDGDVDLVLADGDDEMTEAELALLTEFLLPIARACADGEGFTRRWAPGGPWTTSS